MWTNVILTGAGIHSSPMFNINLCVALGAMQDSALKARLKLRGATGGGGTEALHRLRGGELSRAGLAV